MHVLNSAVPQLLQCVLSDICVLEALWGAEKQPGAVQCHVPDPAYCYAAGLTQVDRVSTYCGVPIVPPHELSGRQHAGQILCIAHI